MRYVSVCSGIEAATVAWHPLGWTPVAFSEIEKFPSAVLAHHYPDIPNLGDMTQHERWPIGPGSIDLLVGGTPCQSFSVAGLRKGLADPRGNLALTYLAIADRIRPRWLVWENVPGVLSSSGGRDFGSFLGALVELGYGFAYRVLDAQWFGVAQRRRRVFVVGHLGDWRRAAAVLLECESLRGDPAPSRAKGQGAAADAQGGARAGSWWDGSDCDSTLTKEGAGGNQRMPDKDNFGAVLTPLSRDNAAHAAVAMVNMGGDKGGASIAMDGTSFTLSTNEPHAVAIGFNHDQSAKTRSMGEREQQAPTLRAGAEAAVAFSSNMSVPDCQTDGTTPTVKCGGSDGGNPPAVAIGFDGFQSENPKATHQATIEGTGPLIRARPHCVATAMAVRRLTPVECERLQGFPDGYTAIPWRGKPASECPDGPRYRALGNSMAVPCMRWIGQRIAQVDAIAV